jgi:putative DNA primase/helicase
MNYGSIPVIDVAHELLGAEDRHRSSCREKHFPDHAGLFVNIDKNRWYSHGNASGGDAVDLIKFIQGCGFSVAKDWLDGRGYLNGHGTNGSGTQKRVLIETYVYKDEHGVAQYNIDRYEPKWFSQWRTIDGARVNGVSAALYECGTNGQWYRIEGKPRVGNMTRTLPAITPLPYRLPELIAAAPDWPVLIAGGEKDVDNLRTLGLVATTNHGGEGHWRSELSPWLKGRRVFILCDNDPAGEKHQDVVGTALSGIASEIRVVRFDDLPQHGDVSDFIELHGAEAKAKLAERCKSAPVWEPQTIATAAADWPEPVALTEGLAPVPVLDTALLPAKIRPWIDDISDRMQCPPDFVGIPAIVALGSVLGRKIGVRPQKQTDWLEVPNLWGCIVGRPGLLKSPAIHEVMKPLHRLEMDANQNHAEATADYQKKYNEWKLKTDVADQAARAALKTGKAATFKFDDAEPTAPVEKRYFTNDTTYERLGEILADNPNGVLAHRDELVSLLKTLDREEYAAARGFFLTAWNGTSPYKFDRIGRGATHIPAACLSLLGSTQPGRLSEYVKRAVKGGAGDDGLIQRFGLLVWPDQKMEWKEVDRYPNSEARKAAWDIFVNFGSTTPEHFGAQRDEFDPAPYLRLDAEASDLFSEWRRSLEERLRSGEMHPALESHLAKYRKLVPALALINHLADSGTGDITRQPMLRALGLAAYLESHAIRVYGAGNEAEIAAAKAILKHIRGGDLKDGFSARDVYRGGWSNLTDRDDVQAGLYLLRDLDWIVEAKARPNDQGGRPTVRYNINPRGMK